MRAIALAAPGWADHHQNLVQVGSAADDIAEPLTENVDGLGLGGPKRLEEREPVSGFGSVRLIIERNGCLVEEQRRMWDQTTLFEIEETVANGDDDA
jgi:hypothetical protein